MRRLRELARKGLRINDIARRLGRSYSSVQHKGQAEGIWFAHTLASPAGAPPDGPHGPTPGGPRDRVIRS